MPLSNDLQPTFQTENIYLIASGRESEATWLPRSWRPCWTSSWAGTGTPTPMIRYFIVQRTTGLNYVKFFGIINQKRKKAQGYLEIIKILIYVYLLAKKTLDQDP